MMMTIMIIVLLFMFIIVYIRELYTMQELCIPAIETFGVNLLSRHYLII